MGDIIGLSLALIAIAAAINYFRSSKPTGARSNKVTTNPYHAVAIAEDAASCAAVAPLLGKRFLAAEAPLLPVVGCKASPCGCRYLHFTDRRSEDRRFPFGVRRAPDPHLHASERRRRERRKSDDFVYS